MAVVTEGILGMPFELAMADPKWDDADWRARMAGEMARAVAMWKFIEQENIEMQKLLMLCAAGMAGMADKLERLESVFATGSFYVYDINDGSWWRSPGKGYTRKVKEAHIYTDKDLAHVGVVIQQIDRRRPTVLIPVGAVAE